MIGRSVARLAPINERLLYADSALKSRFSTAPTSLLDVLSKVRDGTMSPLIASNIITNASGKSSESILDNFSNLDHERSRRTGFPEAIFAEGKTKEQVFRYMEDMAIVVNHALKNESDKAQTARPQAILATRYVV